jgi:L-iditol 2-dehydrogenase
LSRAESAAVLYGPGDLRVESRAVDEPGEGQVLVAVTAVGVCGSDVHYFEHGALGPNVVRAPHVLGHEFCGRVVAAGRRAAGRVGERVAVEPGIPCRACPQCRAGRYNLCPNLRFLGAPPHDGALRGHVAVEADFAHPLPDTISDQAGALIEPLAVALWACWRAELRGGEGVLITGAGPVGLLCAQVARALGAAQVTLVDLNPRRLEMARALGFEQAEAAPPAGQAADVLIECSGSPEALAAGVAAVRPGATVVIVGMAAEGSVTFSLEALQRRELKVVGSFRYADCYPQAIAMASAGQVLLEPLITGRFGLDDVPGALTAAKRDPSSLKSIVIP